MNNKTLVERFISGTSGGRDAGIALLREFIFRTNTGVYPDHLGQRPWRTWKVKGKKVTWHQSA
jgi:hypothetical protein